MKLLIGFILASILICSCHHNIKLEQCKISRGQDSIYLKENYGYDFFFDLRNAQDCSKKTSKKLLLIFTTINCVASSDTHYGLFRNREIKKLIYDNYIPTILYCDNPTNGNVYFSLLINRFKTNATPTYVIVDSTLKQYGNIIGYLRPINYYLMAEHLKKYLD